MDINVKIIVGKNLKKIRETRSLTQENLGELINMTSQSISRIEVGQTYPLPETIDLICEKLNITPSCLFESIDVGTEESKIIQISDKLKSLNCRKLNFINNAIDFISKEDI